MSFQLPPEITFSKQKISETDYSFIFRHCELGELGRILVQGSQGQTHISCEVVGDHDDPLTAKRKKIFEPVGKKIADLMSQKVGVVGAKTTPPPPEEKGQTIASKVLQCYNCDTPVAMLIFADHADTPDKLEDYARMMFANVKKMNLPTWVVGPPIGKGNFDDLPSDILKIHPTREHVRRLHQSEFTELDKLQGEHC